MNQEILKKLKTAPELSPDVHDGSYELVRTIVSAYRDVDEAVLDYWEYFSHSLQHTKALVSNHQFDSIQTTATEPLEEADPAGLVLFHAFGGTKNLTVPVHPQGTAPADP